MFIDSHMHVNFRGYSTDDIIAYMDRNGIDKCWLLTWEEMNSSNPDYMHLSVEEVFESYERHPSRIVPMYAPDPNRSDATERLRTWYEKGVRGCGELKVSLNWDSVKLDPLLSCVAELGIPIVFHLQDSTEFFIPSSNSLFDRCLAILLNMHHLSGFTRKALASLSVKLVGSQS